MIDSVAVLVPQNPVGEIILRGATTNAAVPMNCLYRLG